MKLTAEQLHIIQHSLGCDKHGRSEHHGSDEGDGCFEFHRNRYVSDPDADLCALVGAGLMTDAGKRSELCGGMHYYFVTEAGVEAMKEQSPPAPKLSRSKKRYLAFLHADSGMTFIEWLQTWGKHA